MDQLLFFLYFNVSIRELHWVHNHCNNASCNTLFSMPFQPLYSVHCVVQHVPIICICCCVSAVSVLVFFCFYWNSAPCACAVDQPCPLDHVFTWRKWRLVVRLLSYSLSSWAHDDDDGVLLWRRRSSMWWRILPVMGRYEGWTEYFMTWSGFYYLLGVLLVFIKKIPRGC